ncbi:hypothetical protein [Pseudomonas mucidolens]|uniref:Uncharacterized protein n=1 Tax=Pseudomonas mucidolens TaxID=46679 RepID=A0A1H2N2S0_9PSED|nr:hypothetical protein [Pseudomonas mucidolens]SDU99548.1 hypothetical protein SAMN05216202_2847 [Pseudomonas mucidolens]SQH32773.1 Uncharacterised protein [Pseudomonas mucidolens]
MDVDDNTDDWLGCPTPLEMYKHPCAMLEDALIETQSMLRKARANVAGLVQMKDMLATGKALAESELAKAQLEIHRLNYQSREMGRKNNSRQIVAGQRERLLRENQRLLLELSVLRGHSPDVRLAPPQRYQSLIVEHALHLSQILVFPMPLPNSQIYIACIAN